jgi:hypothetical protein
MAKVFPLKGRHLSKAITSMRDLTMKINKLSLLFAALVSLTGQCLAQEFPPGYLADLGEEIIYVVDENAAVCGKNKSACGENCCSGQEECKAEFNRRIKKIKAKCVEEENVKSGVTRGIVSKCNPRCVAPAICEENKTTHLHTCAFYGPKPPTSGNTNNPPAKEPEYPPTAPKPPSKPNEPKPAMCGGIACPSPRVCIKNKCDYPGAGNFQGGNGTGSSNGGSSNGFWQGGTNNKIVTWEPTPNFPIMSNGIMVVRSCYTECKNGCCDEPPEDVVPLGCNPQKQCYGEQRGNSTGNINWTR